MDNKSRNIHRSGALGELLKRGHIAEVNADIAKKQDARKSNHSHSQSYALKDSNVKFSSDELVYIDPIECEPWEFANRGNQEMGDIDGLMESISKNKQMVPVLVRRHQKPHAEIKYEVIFGRRRYEACLKLGIPLLAIRKEEMDLKEALISQHSENKHRDDVSPYSDSIIYKKLLDEGYYANQTALAKALNISKQTVSDILNFTKLPEKLIKAIPNLHKISTHMCKALCFHMSQSSSNIEVLINHAAKFGDSINSASAVDSLFVKQNKTVSMNNEVLKNKPTHYLTEDGKKLFTYRESKGGAPTIILNTNIVSSIGADDVCKHLKEYLEGLVS